jgi:tetratricopeptide (TPR) repeat protein
MKCLKGIVLAILLIGSAALAAGEKEELATVLASLKSNPGDTSLQEKAIKLVQSKKAKPKAPPELDAAVGKAKYILKQAKAPADYVEAAKAYEEVVALAPWVADHHFNLATIQEKAGNAVQAKAHFELYLLANPKAKDAKAIREKLGGLDYAAKKQAGVDAVIAMVKARFGTTPMKPDVCCYTSPWVEGSTGMQEGCNQAEANGSNWYGFDFPMHFEYPGDGTINMCSDSVCTTQAVPKAPYTDINSLEWFDLERNPTTKEIVSRKPAPRTYELRERSVRSTSRKPDEPFDPNRRYSIWNYKLP